MKYSSQNQMKNLPVRLYYQKYDSVQDYQTRELNHQYQHDKRIF